MTTSLHKEDIIKALSEDRNAYSLLFVKVYGITPDDLRGKMRDGKGRVRDDVLASWREMPCNCAVPFPSVIPPRTIEFYFWGTYGAGKTSVVAALTKALLLGHGVSYDERQSDYWHYSMSLQRYLTPVHSGQTAGFFPTATPLGEYGYCPLKVRFKEGKREREVRLSLIEVPCGIFESLDCEWEGKPYKTEWHKRAVEQLKAYLQNRDNDKYHFFVIDSNCNSDSELETNQIQTLQKVVCCFKDMKLFNLMTKGMNLIVTKCDLMSPNRDEWGTCTEKMLEEKYGFFIDSLKYYRKELGIKNDIKVISFSVGEQFLQQLCVFDPESATQMLEFLMNIIKEDFRNYPQHLRIRRFFR